MKKAFLFSLLAFVGFAPHVLAQGFVPIAPIPGLTQGVVANSAGLADFFNNLYKYLIGLAATLAVIQIIWAGLDIAFWHKDAVSAITEDKGKIYNALFGLVLVLSPVLVFSIINPSILNLSLNLPEIKLLTPVAGTPGTPTPPPAQDPVLAAALAAGCEVLTATPLELYCPASASAAAQAFVDACIAKGGTGEISNDWFTNKIRATCSTPLAAACTTTSNSGQYFETAVCASLNDANSYQCKNSSLTLYILPSSTCKEYNPTTGACADTSVNAYCTSSTDLTVYKYYNTISGTTGSAVAIPSDSAKSTAFTSGCSAQGGTPVGEPTAAATAFLLSRAYQVSNGCPADVGVTVPSQYSGMVCYSAVLSCRPPQQ
ncbi:MAG: hypothetical protein WAV50_02745 [Minisyncoccia bacterium]